jgi:predicted RNA-binding Zn-ribbon protein involved in translation (DUF1610 family)
MFWLPQGYGYDPTPRPVKAGEHVDGLCPKCGAEKLLAAARDGEQGLQKVCKLCGWRAPM